MQYNTKRLEHQIFKKGTHYTFLIKRCCKLQTPLLPDQKGLLVIHTRLTWWKDAARYTNNTYWHTIEYLIYMLHVTWSKDAAQYTHYRIPDQKMLHNMHTLQLPDQKMRHNTHPECPAYCMQELTPWQSAAHCQYSGRCVCERVSDSVNCHSPTQLQPS